MQSNSTDILTFLLKKRDVAYTSLKNLLDLNKNDFINMFQSILTNRGFSNDVSLKYSNELFDLYRSSIKKLGVEICVEEDIHKETGFTTVQISEIYEYGTELIPGKNIWRGVKATN